MRIWSLLILCTGFWLIVAGCEKQPAGIPGEKSKTGREVAMSVTLEWLGHASFKITHDEDTIYIDPWKLRQSTHDASLVLVSHSHYDHYSADDIAKSAGNDTELIASADVVQQQGTGRTITPGQTINSGDISITGVAAYNPAKQFHPKKNNWVGFVIEVGSKRIYYAGDTDLIDEMNALGDIDLALLPVGGTYTMNAEEAALAVGRIKPAQAMPYHWGDIVGSRGNADQFAEKAECKVTVMTPGTSINL